MSTDAMWSAFCAWGGEDEDWDAYTAGWNACKAARYAEVHELREALRECANDLEAELNARYPDLERNTYPDIQRRYNRDMVVVLDARALLTKGDDNAG